MINDREKLEQIFALVKNVKKRIVMINPSGEIFGTDEQFATMNYIENENLIDFGIDIPYVFMTNEFSTFMRNIKELKTPIIDNKHMICANGKSAFDINVLPNHLDLVYDFYDLYNTVSIYKDRPIIYTEENFQENNSEMLFMKSADFSKMFTFGIDMQYILTSFNSIHPVNKSDRVDVVIRDCDQFSCTAEFIIYKKKGNYKLHEFIRFRKM